MRQELALLGFANRVPVVPAEPRRAVSGFGPGIGEPDMRHGYGCYGQQLVSQFDRRRVGLVVGQVIIGELSHLLRAGGDQAFLAVAQ